MFYIIICMGNGKTVIGLIQQKHYRKPATLKANRCKQHNVVEQIIQFSEHEFRVYPSFDRYQGELRDVHPN